MHKRRPRQLPLPRSFKPEQREHWLDRYEREIDEHQEALRKSADEAPEADGQWGGHQR